MKMDNRKRPFSTCPACGTPHVTDSHGLMLYFENQNDRDMFVQLAEREMPAATAYPVDPPKAAAN